MMDMIRQQWRPTMSLEQKLNVTREFLQIICLKTLSDHGWFRSMAFLGGTSLRILFDLRRYSEDLDFSVTRRQKYNFKKLSSQLIKELHLWGLKPEGRGKAQGAVHNVMLKFPGLLKNLGLSPLNDQKLSVKVEIDTNPPAGWKLSQTVVNKVYMFPVVHYDLSSLYAGKLHACFFRKFTKGRDIYDLLWYLSKGVSPNLVLLNHAIHQTHPKEAGVSEKNFQDFLLARIEKIDFPKAKKDIERFLEDKSELRLFDRDLFRQAVK